MDKKFKKIIAREGLILLGLIISGFVLSLLSEKLYPVDLLAPYASIQVSIRNSLEELATFLVIFAYPSYLLIRFIIWAIRTLRQKD